MSEEEKITGPHHESREALEKAAMQDGHMQDSFKRVGAGGRQRGANVVLATLILQLPPALMPKEEHHAMLCEDCQKVCATFGLPSDADRTKRWCG